MLLVMYMVTLVLYGTCITKPWYTRLCSCLHGVRLLRRDVLQCGQRTNSRTLGFARKRAALASPLPHGFTGRCRAMAFVIYAVDTRPPPQQSMSTRRQTSSPNVTRAAYTPQLIILVAHNVDSQQGPSVCVRCVCWGGVGGQPCPPYLPSSHPLASRPPNGRQPCSQPPNARLHDR